MIIEKTILEDCLVITPNVFKDNRGFFYEHFNAKAFQKHTNLNVNFVQDNFSKSSYGVIRGLHYQKGNYSQAKLVSVIEGKVLDCVVDLRQSSPSFGKSFSIELSQENKLQLFVPRGFAHGFSVLSKTAQFFYKCDNFYNKESETGILYNDETLNIDWKINSKDVVISKKDEELESFKNAYYF